jgi:hypothetical protein
LVFAVGQVVAVMGVLFALPAMRFVTLGPALILALTLVDLAILVVFAAWINLGAVSMPMEQLSSDVNRIADGDYLHRVGETRQAELREIRDGVNRLADRLIADQQLLAENVQSLEETNRELLIARDELVRSARLASVGTLAAGIAHEVGNPLGAVMAFADVARSRAEKEGGDTEILESIRSEAKRIDKIVRGLLDYARPPEDAAGPSSAQEVLERVRGLLESQGRLDDVQHAWESSGGPLLTVLEPHRLEQVMVNLLLNALHALESAEERRIVVRLFEEEGPVSQLPRRREGDPPGIDYMHRRRIEQADGEVAFVASAEMLTVIEVSDSGPGIPEEHLEHIFDPFFTTKEPGEGTGLGLSICARLVEGMGGRIDAQNGSEGGAVFAIRLPSFESMGVRQIELSVADEALETT